MIALDIFRTRYGVIARPEDHETEWLDLCAEVQAQLEMDMNNYDQWGEA